MPPSSRGRPTARPISSLTQAMAVSSVPMSGPGMYSFRLRIPAAKARTKRSFSERGIDGSPKITDFAPPCANPAAAFLKVMARARRKHSSVLTSGAMRVPPIAGPTAVLSITTMALRPRRGSWMWTIFSGPSGSAKSEDLLHAVHSSLTLGRTSHPAARATH